MSEYREIWRNLGLDMERHDILLKALKEIYAHTYLRQKDRPRGMKYFDFVVSEVHGLRIKEIMDHKTNGGKVVGTFCVFVPDEIIWAANGISVGLCGGAQFTIQDAEAVLPRNLCPLIKSAYGFKVGKICPYFESTDFLVGETTCDGKKKVWELFNDLQSTYVMEVPQKKGEKDLGLWLHEVVNFKEFMEKESGKSITKENLKESIGVANEKRKSLERLYNLRKATPPPISGKDASLISQIAFYDDPERFTQKVNELCDELEQRIETGVGIAKTSAPRILITGCPMAVPNWKIHHLIEESNGIVVCEETCTGTRYFQNPVITPKSENIDDQLKAIAGRYLSINCACFTPNEERIEQIVKYAREWNVDGVISYVLQFCHGYNIEAIKVGRAMEKEKIPILSIEADYSEDTGQLKTRIEAFLEQIST